MHRCMGVHVVVSATHRQSKKHEQAAGVSNSVHAICNRAHARMGQLTTAMNTFGMDGFGTYP